MNNQKTIAKETVVADKGLFSGNDVVLRMKPADVDHGIEFIRVDLDPPVSIPLDIDKVTQRMRRTALCVGEAYIETIEHFMGAVNALGITNLIVEIDNVEMPNIDGSCHPFTEAFLEAGIIEQSKKVQPFVITEPITVKEGDAVLYALPDKSDELTVIYELDYSESEPLIGRQLYRYHHSQENFVSQISPARTFILQKEAEHFSKQGIGAHLTGKDVLVIGPEGPLDNEFRFQDECVRHKIADLLGDIMLLGRPIHGRIVAYRSGHSTNHKLVHELLSVAEKQKEKKTASSDTVLDIRKIQKILPHRYPFLMVDRVISIEGDKRAVGIKNVTMNEPFFQGHFPGTPIMPGVLIVEALAQMSGLLFAQRLEHTGQLAVLLSMDKVKMRKAVVPGDQLILEVEAVRIKSRTGDCKCKAMVGDQLAAEAQIRFMLVDADPE